MKRFCYIVLTGVLISLMIMPAQAAQPSSGTLERNGPNRRVEWTGGPFEASNPVACTSSVDPSCDHFALTIDDELDGENVLVAIDGQHDSDDYDLFVYYPDGSLAAASATPSGDESVVFQHDLAKGDGPYEVRVQPWLVASGSTYAGIAATTSEPIDVERECLEPVPDTVGIPGVTDDGGVVSLDVVTLYDGVEPERAEAVLAKAAAAYAPLNVQLNPVDFQRVNFAGDDAQGLIDQAKDSFGGVRPDGADLVYVLTATDIQVGGAYGVAGLADCIGGVRFPEHAFAVGEDAEALGYENIEIGPFVFYQHVTAKILAHELGHLMGAHHHYANCAEGADPDDLTAPCTLMFNFVDFQGLGFSSPNTAVVRGHAWEYAR